MNGIFARHSTTIMTAMSILGVGATAFFTGKGVLKAKSNLEVGEQIRYSQMNPDAWNAMTPAERQKALKPTTKEFIREAVVPMIPAIISATSTCCSIIALVRHEEHKIAVAVASEKAIELSALALKDSIKEKFSEESVQEIYTEAAKKMEENYIPTPKNPKKFEAVNANAKNAVLSEGEQMYCFNGCFFKSTPDKITYGLSKFERESLEFGYGSENDLKRNLGLSEDYYSELGHCLGWTVFERGDFTERVSIISKDVEGWAYMAIVPDTPPTTLN